MGRKKIQRIVSLMSLFVVVFNLVSISSHATEVQCDRITAIQEADEYINDNLDVLVDEAKGDTDMLVDTAELISDTGEVLELPVYEIDTTDVINQFSSDENLHSITYAVDTSDIVSAAAASYSGNKYASTWDSTGSIQAYLTIYYTYTNDLSPQYLFTSIAGGYTRADSQVSVASQSLTYGYSGIKGSSSVTKYPTSSSWSYTTGFTTYNPGYSLKLGGNYTLNLKRGTSSTWTLYLQNNL